MTQSSSSLNVRKGTTSTDSTENVDIDHGGSFGLSVTTPKGGGGISSSQQQEGDNRTERLIDPRGNVATFRFDGLDRPIVSTDAAGNAVRHHFDAAGNLTSIEEDEVEPAQCRKDVPHRTRLRRAQ